MMTYAKISVTTYNILDRNLARSELFDVDARHLEPKKRLTLITETIQEDIAKESIITFQEVGRIFGKSKVFKELKKSGYVTLTAYTGEKRLGMGTAIAYPSKYKLVRHGRVRIGEKIPLPRDHEKSEHRTLKNPKGEDQDYSLFDFAKSRDQILLWAILKEKVTGAEFFVATYHMPCAYWWPSVMLLHADTVLREVEKLAGDLPIILAGDLNSCLKNKETSDVLKFFLEDVTVEGITSLWKPASKLKLKSANTTLLTTRTKSPDRPIFEGTLDHVLYSGCDLLSVDIEDISDKILPDATHGSDHVPVRVTLVK